MSACDIQGVYSSYTKERALCLAVYPSWYDI